MKKPIKKFLQFNGRTISFLDIDGQYWVAIKPICEALNVNYDRQYKNLRADLILRDAYAIQPMRDTKNRIQNMVSLPERYIYGWLDSIRSESKELQAYKKECYDVLYDHFHGVITNRRELLKRKTDLQKRAGSIEEQLVENEAYQELQSVKSDITVVSKELNALDKQVVSEQMDLWNQES